MADTTQTATAPKVLAELNNQIKTITINNPKAKNSVSPETTKLLLEELGKSMLDGTRVIILTGAEGNFCSGADLGGSTMQNPRQYDVTTYLRTTINPVVATIRNMNIPVIAKVRGVAAGVGANFALACDMVYAAEGAMFSEIFTNIALSSDGGGAYFMVKAVGYHKAFELMATAAKIKADEALQLGLINHLLPENELDTAVQTMAERLANGPYVAIQQTKANLREAMKGTLESTLEAEALNQARNFQTEDMIEGVVAFLQKRPANWKGK